MQLLENWDPLRLPRGSVRALVTLALLGVLWALMLLDREVPLSLSYLVLLVLGHYFGSRAQPSPDPVRRQPLFLPRGTIRFVIILGFAAVGYSLWERGRLDLSLENRSSAMLFLPLALIAGVVVRKIAYLFSRGEAAGWRRFFENVKAVVVLSATALLAVVVLWGGEDKQHKNLALLLAPLIGFYFGSRH